LKEKERKGKKKRKENLTIFPALLYSKVRMEFAPLNYLQRNLFIKQEILFVLVSSKRDVHKKRKKSNKSVSEIKFSLIVDGIGPVSWLLFKYLRKNGEGEKK